MTSLVDALCQERNPQLLSTSQAREDTITVTLQSFSQQMHDVIGSSDNQGDVTILLNEFLAEIQKLTSSSLTTIPDTTTVTLQRFWQETQEMISSIKNPKMVAAFTKQMTKLIENSLQEPLLVESSDNEPASLAYD